VTRVEMLLREAKPFAAFDRSRALAYLGTMRKKGGKMTFLGVYLS
jgi:hypothetical protein